MITSTRLTWQHRFETTLICQLTVIYRSIRSMKPLVETAGWNYRLKRPVETTDESIDRTTEKTSGKSSLISRFCCRVWRTSKHNFAQRFPLPSWQLLLEIFLFEVLTNVFLGSSGLQLWERKVLYGPIKTYSLSIKSSVITDQFDRWNYGSGETYWFVLLVLSHRCMHEQRYFYATFSVAQLVACVDSNLLRRIANRLVSRICFQDFQFHPRFW